MSFLTEEFEKLVHLMARALARTHGQVESAETYAGTVLEHAKTIAEEDAAKVKVAIEGNAAAIDAQKQFILSGQNQQLVQDSQQAQQTALPPGDQPAQPAA